MHPDHGRYPVAQPPEWPLGPSRAGHAVAPLPRQTPRAVLMVALAVTAVALLVLAGVGGYQLGRSRAATLSAPVLVSPPEGQSFDFYPRTTPVSWDRVDGARTYVIDVQFFNARDDAFRDAEGKRGTVDATQTNYTFSFVGAQQGRWRVTALGADGTAGPPSPWRTFVYQR